MAVIVPFESPSNASIDGLVGLVAADMERVNATILSRTGSEVTMIPEVANHLISSGGKRLRPMLTLAMAQLADYSGDGHIKLAAAVEFMHTATLLHDDVLDYGGKSAKLGKNVGDDFREGKITLPVVLAFRRGNDTERQFWIRALERGEIGSADLDHAIGLMTKHRALEDTISRAQHYGAMAVDALALFPSSPMKTALEQVVAFCLARSH